MVKIKTQTIFTVRPWHCDSLRHIFIFYVQREMVKFNRNYLEFKFALKNNSINRELPSHFGTVEKTLMCVITCRLYRYILSIRVPNVEIK